MNLQRVQSLLLLLPFAMLAHPAVAADWPAWRYDAARTAASPQELPAKLHLQWVRDLPPPEPAWGDPVNRDRMTFERVLEPVVAGTRMFVGSGRNDKLTVLDTRTGKEKWSVFVGGPIRLPPVVADGKVYFVSDDGYLYCLRADTGRFVWKFRGGPSNRKVLGNGRLISAWPARGGPVVADGVVYFAASVWPFTGTFIHALDAETGNVVWTNDGTGSRFGPVPHSVAFGGIAPQGAIAVIGDKLLVAGGRSVPACLDRGTGELLYCHLGGSRYFQTGESADRKLEGGSHVSAVGQLFFNHRGINTAAYDVDTGQMIHLWHGTTYPVLTEEVCYLSGNAITAYSLKDRKLAKIDVDGSKKNRWQLNKLWECPVDATAGLIKAGGKLYAGGEGVVSAVELDEAQPKVVWTEQIAGTAARLLAADDRLFVVTLEGHIYAFGAEKTTTTRWGNDRENDEARMTNDEEEDVTQLAKKMLGTTSLDQGYCLVFGLETGDLAEAVVRNSNLDVIAVDPDPEKVGALRRRFDAAGLYGKRISVHVGDATTFRAPPYVAVLVASENLSAAGFDAAAENGGAELFLRNLFYSVRPYGGVAWLPTANPQQKDALVAFARKYAASGVKITRAGVHYLLRRQGPLPGSAPWTHLYGNVAATVKSDDRLVKAPLGVLWFGGNTHTDILPRHSHGPPEQVVGGRLFIEGINVLTARDVYTGKDLWRRQFKDLGTFGIYIDETYVPDPLDTTYNLIHLPGANARGTNYVATDDRLYLVAAGKCAVLDPATGESITMFSLPASSDAKEKTTWGYIGVYEDLLIAGQDYAQFTKQVELKPGPDTSSRQKKMFQASNYDVVSSQKLVVMDRHTGKVRWTRPAKLAFRHNTICAGGGKLFCIDGLPNLVADSMRRKGVLPDDKPELLALDVRTGDVLWSTTENVFGSWLSYSRQHDLLVQSGRASRDMLIDEPDRRIAVFHCAAGSEGRWADGSIAWDKQITHGGPCIIHGETLHLSDPGTGGRAVSLLTGEVATRQHPLTGEAVPWHYARNYGCGSAVACENLLTFRSGAAGYYDLTSDGGTGNFGGFKSGCTDNLIPADGVLNAPDYTRTCTCSYQNQTSLALIHAPDVPTWTHYPIGEIGTRRIERLGLNLGAPGDRMGSDGTLWLGYSLDGSPLPKIDVEVDSDGSTYRRHASRVTDDAMSWVTASGLTGASKIVVTLAQGATDKRLYTVRLYFAEPQSNAQSGGRVFDVSIQGKPLLTAFDIVAAADGPGRTIRKEFKDVSVGDVLTVEFAAKSGEPLICGIEMSVQP
ncbi:MAG: PQQ-binding-like beta-propeller repeat protein [Candidatus Nealsonbacteria bacterium]|nr:PQQ-binding-like beta-propeller repeat protein [Candidatus Nealsonbacteria bacterium]